jgi:pyruvate dehydrogenase E2 component (dihydrolipoamide acetyltransferase)
MMAEIVIMPKLGFDMAEGTLVRWVVKEGDPIEKGAILAEIETDKATVEVESSYSGFVKRHLVEEGTVVPVNSPIAVVGRADEQIDYTMLLGEGAQQIIESPKAAELAHEPQVAPVGLQPVEESEMAGDVVSPPLKPEPGEAGQLPGGVRASPLARRLAEDLGLDLSKIKGTGPGGRIVKTDIEEYRAALVTTKLPSPKFAPLPMSSKREDKRIPLSRLRSAIGRRMVQAKQQAPHFYVTHEYDVQALMDLRSQINNLLLEEEKISVNDLILKAVSLTLREFPNLNAALDEQTDEVVQFGHINLGVAVSVENGLLTVVCKDTDLKSLTQISSEIKAMAGRAREGKVKPDDIEGSTFSVSNLGMFAVEEFIAIINPPEAAILAIGSATSVPVVKNGEIVTGLRMKATISVDHRVSDGVEAARFLQSLARYLEQPLRLMI